MSLPTLAKLLSVKAQATTIISSQVFFFNAISNIGLRNVVDGFNSDSREIVQWGGGQWLTGKLLDLFLWLPQSQMYCASGVI